MHIAYRAVSDGLAVRLERGGRCWGAPLAGNPNRVHPPPLNATQLCSGRAACPAMGAVKTAQFTTCLELSRGDNSVYAIGASCVLHTHVFEDIGLVWCVRGTAGCSRQQREAVNERAHPASPLQLAAAACQGRAGRLADRHNRSCTPYSFTIPSHCTCMQAPPGHCPLRAGATSAGARRRAEARRRAALRCTWGAGWMRRMSLEWTKKRCSSCRHWACPRGLAPQRCGAVWALRR